MFDQKSISIFIESLTNFYRQMGIENMKVGTPYLQDSSEPPISEFTGVIGISGAHQGCVYFTCPREILSYLLKSMGEDEIKLELLSDLVGEIANTIAGNARKHFGEEFMISVPVIVQGYPERIYLPENTKCVVIPTHWKTYQSIIVVALV